MAKVTKSNQKIIKIPKVTNFPYNLSSVRFVYYESLQFCLVFTICLLYVLSTLIQKLLKKITIVEVYIHVPTHHLHCIYAHEYICNHDRKYRFLFPQTIGRLVSPKAPLACMGFSFWQSTFVRFIHPPPLTGYYITGPATVETSHTLLIQPLLLPDMLENRNRSINFPTAVLHCC